MYRNKKHPISATLPDMVLNRAWPTLRIPLPPGLELSELKVCAPTAAAVFKFGKETPDTLAADSITPVLELLSSGLTEREADLLYTREGIQAVFTPSISAQIVQRCERIKAISKTHITRANG